MAVVVVVMAGLVVTMVILRELGKSKHHEVQERIINRLNYRRKHDHNESNVRYILR